MAIAFLAMVLSAGWPWIGSANPPAHVVRPGRTTVIEGRWGGKPVHIQITPAMLANCHEADWLHGAAPDRQDRCLRLAGLKITVGGRPLALSSSGYADLGGVNDVVVRFGPTRLILYLRGPDGPDYYGATLEFDGHDIVRRRLDLADGGVEITTYRAGAAAGL